MSDQHFSSRSRSEFCAPQNDKNYGKYCMVPYAGFLLHEPEKCRKYATRRTCTCSHSKNNITETQGKLNKSNPLEHFECLATRSRFHGGHEKLLPLCHTVVRALELPSPGGAFPDQKCGWSYGRMTECLTGKNTEVEMLPVDGLFQEPANIYTYIYYIQAGSD